MRKEKYVIDRIENGIMVLLSDKDDTELLVRKENHSPDLSENDTVYVVLEAGEVKEIIAAGDETKKKKAEIRKRFASLFDRKK